MGKSSKQKHGKCIFCGQGGLSKQHVIPDWMSSIIPDVNVKHAQSTISTSIITGSAIPITTVLPEIVLKDHNGVFGQRKIRNVCRPCNGGWISQIENNAKPFLNAMILGKRISLNENDARTLALAIAIMTIMNEFTDPNPSNIMIPSSHLRKIKEDRELPAGWHIALGLMNTHGDSKARHHNYKYICKIPHGHIPKEGGYQLTTFTLGHLMIQSATLINFDHPLVYAEPEYFQLWPFSGEKEDWREKLVAWNHAQFSQIADPLHHIMMQKLYHMVNIAKVM